MPIDYSKYPPNWKSEIVPFVRGRSGGVCERCGNMVNGNLVYSVPLWIKDGNHYKRKMLWFTQHGDALRAANFNEKIIKSVKVVLTVAHLDHDECNHEVKYDRLQDMCQWCHLNYDAKEKFRRIHNRVIL